MLKISASILAFAAVVAFSTVASAECFDGHKSASQQLVETSGGKTPMTPKPATGSGG